MGRSRYAGSEVIDGFHYGTWTDPTSGNPLGPDILDGVDTLDHILSVGDRLDLLAHRYYGDSEYWWVIALANRIEDPFALTIGQRLRVPADVKAILNKVHR
jgi:nucleoid-associated protein YgaU